MNVQQGASGTIEDLEEAVKNCQANGDCVPMDKLSEAIRSCIYVCARPPRYLVRTRQGNQRMSGAELKKILKELGEIMYLKVASTTLDKVLRKQEPGLVLCTFDQETINMILNA
jgi:hypothetical protein